MTYRLNVCLLSGIFEKRFGLTNFSRDYNHLIVELNNSFNFLNREKPEYMTETNASIFRKGDYRLFCKLSHFFDDFNFFINIQLSPKITQERYSKFSDVDKGFRAFIRRVESMKIPQQIQDTIAGFLKMQRAKAALATTREHSCEALPQGEMNILHSKARNEEVRKRLIMTTQILQTWQKFPELRLGQLISNSIPEGTDIFYVTDDKLIQLLRNFEANNG